MLTIAFYNLENLFDTRDDAYTRDEGFLPDSARRWTEKRYRKKLRKLGYTIHKIGRKSTGLHPAIVGLAEVENQFVIKDLLKSKFLKHLPYDFVHYDSPDERGIDTALIYDKEQFRVEHSEIFSIDLFNPDGSPDHTRDILLVSGYLGKDLIHILVNHWPSRREGQNESEPKRLKASDRLIEIIEGIHEREDDPRIVVMGDFNDDPSCKSMRQLTHQLDLFNPMETLKSYSRGSVSSRNGWNLFDQILFSTNFFEYSKNKYRFSKAEIFDKPFLKEYKGRFKGNPFRTFVGMKYKGGYSDHFPVYLLLRNN